MSSEEILQGVEDIHLNTSSDSDSEYELEEETTTKSLPLSSRTITEKEDIVTKYADKIKTDPIKRGQKLPRIELTGLQLNKFWIHALFDS